MAKKPKKDKSMVPVEFVGQVQEGIIAELETNPLYSLEPDPTGELNMSDEKKLFLKNYIEFKNVPLASQLTGIDESKGQSYWLDGECRSEIRRINLAMYQRKFSRRLLSIDEIGGYLTSMLIDEDVATADQLPSRDKLKVAQMIIDLNKMKAETYNNPKVIEYVELEEEVKEMDVKSIKQLIRQTKDMQNPHASMQIKIDELSEKKDKLIRQINVNNYLDPSEIAYLKSCSVEELESLINRTKEKLEIKEERD